jgi:enterochelin esterase family protein
VHIIRFDVDQLDSFRRVSFGNGDAFTWIYDAGPTWRLGGGAVEVYQTHPDARVRPGVPKGTVRQMPPWHSKVFPGTTRDWWVYIPAQYRTEIPAAVMIFQDGNAARDYAVPVFDNLIAKGDMPVTVGIFIEPGGVKLPRDNRSFEYDTLSDQYTRFLIEEIIPEVEKTSTQLRLNEHSNIRRDFQVLAHQAIVIPHSSVR